MAAASMLAAPLSPVASAAGSASTNYALPSSTVNAVGGPTGVAVDGANMWVTNIGTNTVTKL